MKFTTEMLIARTKAGYVNPRDQPCICMKCSAIRERKYDTPYYCRRHHFYVNALGYCPAFGTGPFTKTSAPKSPRYRQVDLFD